MMTGAQIEDQARSWFVQLNGDAPESVPVAAWLDFQDWLEADDAHRLAYDAVEQMWVEMDDAASAAPILAPVTAPITAPLPADNTRRAARPAPAGKRRSWLIPSMAAAAAMVLAVGLLPQLGRTVPTEVYQTTTEPRNVILSDGSQIYINRHTDLSVRMEKSRRAITLKDGEAAFDVAHNAERPFIIAAGDHKVQVLGTAFNVINHSDQFQVRVQRGVVAVTPAASKVAVRLTAGQKIDQIGTDAARLSADDTEGASAWRKGVLIYRNNSLEDVAKDLSRYLNKPVTLSPSAQPLHFTGALQVGDEATMLRQLQDFIPIRVTRSPTEIRVMSRDER